MTVTQFQNHYTEIKDPLSGFAFNLTKSRDKAKDLLQETYLLAFKNKHKYTIGTSFKSWVMTIMRHSFITEFRKVKNRRRLATDYKIDAFITEDSCVEEQASSSVMMNELQGMLSEVSEIYRLPFIMFYEDYSYLELAEHFDIPVGTLKSRIFYARKLMKEKITARYEGAVLRRCAEYGGADTGDV